jgi:hypothetical protein
VCLGIEGGTDDLKNVILVWVGPDVEGGRERRRDWNGDLQKPNGLKCSRRRLWSEASYRRCHGESRGVNAPQGEVGVGTLCMERESCTQPDLVVLTPDDWMRPSWARHYLSPDWVVVRAARGRADRLKHQGSLL